MSVLKIYKETSLPAVLDSNSLYFLSDNDLLKIYMTGSDASVVMNVIDKETVDTLIASALEDYTPGTGGSASIQVVDDIATRDLLEPEESIIVLVLDATGDSTVSSGGATYVYITSTSTWKKIGETESMDLILSWANIQNKPTSAVADIDDAVAKRHTHTNKSVLDLLDEDEDGNLTYNGTGIRITLDSNAW